MDIEFIETEHRENVLKLMQVCGIEMKEAYQLYTKCGYNFEASVNHKFNPVQSQPYNPYDYDSHPSSLSEPPFIPPEQDYNPPPFGGDSFFDEDDIEMMEYRKFKQSGKKFDQKYPLKTNKSFFQSFLPTFFKSSQENAFKRDLEKYLDMRVNIKTEHNFLSQAFHWCWKEKFPMVVLILDFREQSLNIVRRFCRDDFFIEKTISEQFKPIGINSREYQLEPQLRQFFDLQKDVNSLIICRVNHLDNIEIVKRIHLAEPMEDIKKKLKQCKSECIQNELNQFNLAKQYIEELRGNFNYVRPKTIQENIKMREDKKLRQKQEKEYFQACKKKEEAPKPQVQPRPQPPPQPNYSQKKVEKPSLFSNPPQQEVKPPAQSESNIRQLRADKLNSLRKYDQGGIMFKIRVPQGRNLTLQVDGNERVQYLFDYIGCQPENLGFENEMQRKFDICIGFGGGDKLLGKENCLLKDLFEGSGVLIVKEL